MWNDFIPGKQVKYFALFLGIVFLLFLSSPVLAGFQIIESANTKTGGIHGNSAYNWEDGTHISSVWGSSNGLYLQGAAAQQIVTGPGKNSYSSDASLQNQFYKTSDLNYTNGGAVWDTLAVESLTPNESELVCEAGQLAVSGEYISNTGTYPDHISAAGMTGAQGNEGHYVSDKTLNTDAYALSASFKGTGMYHANLDGITEAGYDKDSDNMNHREDIHHTQFVYEGINGSMNATTDYVVGLVDFGDPLNLKDLYSANETVADEGGNSTPEEAES